MTATIALALASDRSISIGRLIGRLGDLASVIHAIREAYPDADPPSQIIHDGSACGAPECRQVDELFRGRPWCQLTATQVGKFRFASSLMNEAALAHYLPAFMIVSICVDDAFLDYLIYLLVPSVQDGEEPAPPSVFNILTRPQRAAVAGWLRFVRSLGDDLLPVDLATLEAGIRLWTCE